MVWIWLGLAFTLFFAELMLGEMTALMLSFGAALAWQSALMGFSWPVQVGVFGLGSLALVFFLRPALRDRLQPRSTGLSTDGFVGQSATILEEIVPGHKGKVKFHGEIWFATAYTAIPPGERVYITAIRDNCLEVVPEHELDVMHYIERGEGS